MKSVRLRPPAKINLGLRVLGRRRDGYHNLSTVFCAVSLHDELWIQEAPTLRVRTHGARLRRPDLVERAALLLAASGGIRKGAAIVLKKRIPLGGGLGGGSSDAAAALRGLSKIWGLAPGRPSLRVLAGRLGADVPFFLWGGMASGRGRGDRLRSLPSPRRPRWFVLVLDPKPLSTPAVFGAYDSLKRGRYNRKDKGPYWNDLSAAAEILRPAITRRRRALEAVWNRPLHMSGSGPSLFAEFPSEGAARRALRKASVLGFKNLTVVRSLSRMESLRALTGRV